MLEAEDRAIATVEDSFAGIAQQHLSALARKRSQLLLADDYGVVDRSRWSKELDRFVDAVVLPALSDPERRVLAKNPGRLASLRTRLLEDQSAREADRLSRATLQSGFRADLTPRDFEHWCAEVLTQHGWRAQPTPASGDQGADVIAEMAEHRVVLQCKLYSKPVGNKAIQEVHSAKTFYRATVAAVVSPNGYTASAKALAAATGVLLLDKSDLTNLSQLISA